MNNYYFEYLKSKKVLCKLALQIYDYKLKEEVAKNMNITFDDEDIYDYSNRLVCVFHHYNPEGMYIWHKLGISKPIITMKNMWELLSSIDDEVYDEKHNYYEELIEIKIAIIHIIKNYYKSSIEIEDANKYNIEYDELLDEDDGKIEGCDHMFEGAGEAAWNLLNFDKHFIAISKVEELECKLLDEALNKNKTKKLRKDSLN